MELKLNPNVTMLYADKGLGPVALDTDKYIDKLLNEHLLNDNTYRNITEREALTLKSQANNMLYDIFYNAIKNNKIPYKEKKFIINGLLSDNATDRMSHFNTLQKYIRILGN